MAADSVNLHYAIILFQQMYFYWKKSISSLVLFGSKSQIWLACHVKHIIQVIRLRYLDETSPRPLANQHRNVSDIWSFYRRICYALSYLLLDTFGSPCIEFEHQVEKYMGYACEIFGRQYKVQNAVFAYCYVHRYFVFSWESETVMYTIPVQVFIDENQWTWTW